MDSAGASFANSEKGIEGEQVFFMDRASMARLPNPNEMMNHGHTMYVVDDPLGKKRVRVASNNNVRRNLALEPRNDIERAYLFAANDIAISICRMLTSRRNAWSQAREKAEDEYNAELAQLAQARREAIGLTVSWGFVKTAAVGLLGYLMAQVVGVLVPAEIAAETGSKVPGFVAAIVFIWIFRWLTTTYATLTQNEIKDRYQQHIYEADTIYYEGKLMELRQYEADLHHAWFQYTGEQFEGRSSYVDVMENDVEAHRQRRRRLRNNSTSVTVLRVLRLQKTFVRVVIRRVRVQPRA